MCLRKVLLTLKPKKRTGKNTALKLGCPENSKPSSSIGVIISVLITIHTAANKTMTRYSYFTLIMGSRILGRNTSIIIR